MLLLLLIILPLVYKRMQFLLILEQCFNCFKLGINMIFWLQQSKPKFSPGYWQSVAKDGVNDNVGERTRPSSFL